MSQCERCRSKTAANTYNLFDYCAKCSKNLCPTCMKEGCCGVVPAVSGMEMDEEPAFGDESPEPVPRADV